MEEDGCRGKVIREIVEIKESEGEGGGGGGEGEGEGEGRGRGQGEGRPGREEGRENMFYV